MVSVIGVDKFSIETLTKDDLNVLSKVIDSAPLPEKRVLFKLNKEIKHLLTNA